MRLLRLLFGLKAPIDQKTYIRAGLALAALKYALDFTVVYLTTGKIWTLVAYLSPILVLRHKAIDPAPEMLLWAMAAYTLPFAWIGLTMSVRRAADAGYSPWIGAAFLLPIWNWITILYLCLKPTKAGWQPEEDGELLPVDVRTVLLSVGLGVALTMSMVATSVFILGDYGWSLFIGTPFVVGMLSGWLTNRSGRRSVGASIVTAIASITLSAIATLLFALEGVICIGMAAIPAYFVAIAGALLGRAIAGSKRANDVMGLSIIIALLPFMAGAESLDTRSPLFEVETTVVIDGTPMEVWDKVIHFSELDAPDAWVQATGIAYPIRARLVGEGVGAIRYCEFSTGPFIEPITVWEPGKRLAFDVQSQPLPMKEWSPYREIHPPHLDGYLRSKRGEFRFVELPDGRTRLEGSTWYEIDIAPTSYWSMMSDAMIHRIHLRVLEHVKKDVEVANGRRQSTGL